MNEHAASVIFLPLLLLVIALEIMLVARLEKRHGDVYQEMGRPKFGDSNLGGSIWKLQKFVWGLQFFKLNDPILTLLCIIGMAGELALLYCFIQYT